MKLFTGIICIILMVLTTNLMSQTEVTLTPLKDNTLYENSTGAISNGAGNHLFVGNTNAGSARRGLLAFDLSEIPQGSNVQSVTLTLNMSKTATGATEVTLHRVNADWGEGTSNASGEEGTGASASTNDATWIHTFFNTEMWTNPGGDFAGSSSAMTSVGANGSYTWDSTEDMVADVQNWIDNPEQNFGWLLRGDELSNKTAKRFDTKESSNPPQLVVTYSGATSVSDDTRNLPETISLKQNYPNPFNPSTQIDYAIPASENSVRVKLEIFNLLGEKVNTLVDARQSAGNYSVEWNGHSANGRLVSNGLYFYRLSVADQVILKRMTFLK